MQTCTVENGASWSSESTEDDRRNGLITVLSNLNLCTISECQGMTNAEMLDICPRFQVCQACEVGKYSSTLGATECLDCPANSDSLSSASTACACNAGWSGQAAGCTECVSGKYKIASGDAMCTNCSAGQYSTVAGATSNVCQGCPSNSNAPEASDEEVDCTCNAGSTGPDGENCTQCMAGTYKLFTGAVACEACEVGKYTSQSGTKVCLDCPANASSLVQSSVSTACTCNAGFSNVGYIIPGVYVLVLCNTPQHTATRAMPALPT